MGAVSVHVLQERAWVTAQASSTAPWCAPVPDAQLVHGGRPAVKHVRQARAWEAPADQVVEETANAATIAANNVARRVLDGEGQGGGCSDAPHAGPQCTHPSLPAHRHIVAQILHEALD